MKKINWGIVGLGNIAKRFSDGFFDTNKAKLLAISSLNIKKLEKFKNSFNINEKYIFKDYESLIRCNDIDIVYIALPNNLHYKWILEAIKNNKKILVEKPALLNFSDAKKIKKKIIDKKLFFTEGYMYRYYPYINEVIEIIKKGEIGKPLNMETSFVSNLLTKKKFFFFKKKKKINPDDRLFNLELGGGCILDLGCYVTSFSLLIASLVEGVNHKNFDLVNVKKKIGPTGVDIDAEGEILFEGGFKSKIKASFENDIGNSSIINGDNGKVIIRNTWQGKDEIIKIIKGEKTIIKNNMTKNIYSYQIESISERILEDKNETTFSGFRIDDTLLNTKILEDWLNAKK